MLLQAWSGKSTPKLTQHLEKAQRSFGGHHRSTVPMAWLAKKYANQSKQNGTKAQSDQYWQCSDRACDWVNLARHQWCSCCKKPRETQSPKTQARAQQDSQLAKKVQALRTELKALKTESPALAPKDWVCETCGTDHSNPKVTRCRKCRDPRVTPAQPTPSLPPAAGAGAATSPSPSSQSPSSLPSIVAAIPQFTHQVVTDCTMETCKPLMNALRRVGLKPGSAEEIADAEPLPSTAKASAKVEDLQKAYDMLVSTLPADSDVVQACRKSLDEARSSSSSSSSGIPIKKFSSFPSKFFLPLQKLFSFPIKKVFHQVKKNL